MPGGAANRTRSDITPKSKIRAESSAACTRPPAVIDCVPRFTVTGGLTIWMACASPRTGRGRFIETNLVADLEQAIEDGLTVDAQLGHGWIVPEETDPEQTNAHSSERQGRLWLVFRAR